MCDAAYDRRMERSCARTTLKLSRPQLFCFLSLAAEPDPVCNTSWLDWNLGSVCGVCGWDGEAARRKFYQCRLPHGLALRPRCESAADSDCTLQEALLTSMPMEERLPFQEQSWESRSPISTQDVGTSVSSSSF